MLVFMWRQNTCTVAISVAQRFLRHSVFAVLLLEVAVSYLHPVSVGQLPLPKLRVVAFSLADRLL